jgi:hypothetical protein
MTTADTSAPAPWLTPAAQTRAVCLLTSYRRAFGSPLIAGLAADAPPQGLAQELFASDAVVLAHDGADPNGDPGPRLIYANRAALRLWQRPWAAMVGMPSRLTAEPAEQASRSQALVAAQAQQALSGYSGIRIDSQGRRFQIDGARLWTLHDASGQPCGQAACFSRWWQLAGGT